MSLGIEYNTILSNSHENNLAKVYHRGQKKIWDGRDILSELIEEHGSNRPSKDKLQSIQNIFSTILWGEYVAWNVSSELSMKISDIDAKMAATSQAHDEARHYYVLKDYFNYAQITPNPLPRSIRKVLTSVSNTDNLAKKLLGMQLMIEPIAITIFKYVIKSNVDPVLCNLLKLYEVDEARHIALGTKYLPDIINEMNYYQLADLAVWQLKIMLLEVDGLKELRVDFENLGIDINDVYSFAEKKQLDAIGVISEKIDIRYKPWNLMKNIVRIKKNIVFGK